MPVLSYKSFCWSLGTTSFRTKNFNKSIEEQLTLLNKFWNTAENYSEHWSGNNKLQEKYYDFIKEKGFIEGEAKNKSKDAREKTSGLVDIGLIDENRKLTEVGKIILEISNTGDFSTDNVFQISKDSFIYLKQLLKTSNNVNGENVRPFIVLLYVLSELNYLTLDEYTYLLPLCINKLSTESIIKKIIKLRNKQETIDEIIIDKLMGMENYKNGLKYFLENDASREVICFIGMNRKSKEYDEIYYSLYEVLYKIFVEKNNNFIFEAYEMTKDKKLKIGKLWRKYLFKDVNKKILQNTPEKCLNNSLFSKVLNEKDFKSAFYKVMHLLKSKATLMDYLDLNRRYMKMADIILFEDSEIRMDIIPKQFFSSVIEELYKSAYKTSDLLLKNCAFNEIDNSLVIKEEVIIAGINKELNTNILKIEEVYNIADKKRYDRLENIINTKFTDDKLLILLELFEKRKDKEIRAMVTDNADIPTIFEYILGILWYKVSERNGKILDYLKLSLDADLLPKTHAAGGGADIVYNYEETKDYPKHTLLLEATLTDKTNQRRMEMEPVSRHLGQHLIHTENKNSYCLFVTNFLNMNVISDFRSRKTTLYYDLNDNTKYIDGMKIIPIETKELKNIILKKIRYKELYYIFDIAYKSDLKPHEWYEECILKNISM